jgi:hypothetical protein
MGLSEDEIRRVRLVDPKPLDRFVSGPPTRKKTLPMAGAGE